MYQRILVPLDGSPLAEQVLPYVRILASGLQLPIVLLRALDRVPEQLADPVHGLYTDRLATAFRDEAQRSLDPVRLSLQDIGVPVTFTVEEADPSNAIIDESERVAGTLTAMSTHGRSGVTRWVLGSVTDKVLHAASNPILMLRARPRETFSPEAVATRSERWATAVRINTVTVPLDGSSMAEGILPHVVVVSKALASKVMLIRAATSADEVASATDYLNQVTERLHQEDVSSIEQRVLRGDAASAILDTVQEFPDDLVAMTTHGRSGVGRWVLGSVADRVVRYSGTPVLVVRAAVGGSAA